MTYIYKNILTRRQWCDYEHLKGKGNDLKNIHPVRRSINSDNFEMLGKKIEVTKEKTLRSTVSMYHHKCGRIFFAIKSDCIDESRFIARRAKPSDFRSIGKGRCPSNMVAEVADRQAEHPELGPIGDVLASSGKGILSSVVVIQQHDVAHVEETAVSKILINQEV